MKVSDWKLIDDDTPKDRPILLFARHVEASAATRVVGYWLPEYGWIAQSYAGQGIARLVPSLWQELPGFPRNT